MRPRRRCCHGFCAALSIQHPLSLPLLPQSHFFSILLPVCFSLVFILRHSSSLPFYFALSTFLALSFSFFFRFSSFISIPLARFLSFSLLFIRLYLCSPRFCYHTSLSLSLSVSSFISVALTILLPSKRFRKSSLPATARSILQRLYFSKIPKIAAKYNQCH